MIYLGNGMWSDSGPNLSHGGPWRDHKYIKIVNGRYIYPDDGGNLTKGVRRPGDTVNRRDKANAYKAQYGEMGKSNSGPSTAEKAQSYVYNPYFKNPQYDPNNMNTYRLSKNVDDGKQNESQTKKYWNMYRDYLDKQYPDMNPVGKKGLTALNTGLAVGKDALKKADDLKDDAKEKIKDIKDKKKYGKLYNTIKVTEPSAAQKAQSENGASGMSKNTAGMHLEYGNQWEPAYKAKYGSFWVANGGPSTAELAQRTRSNINNSKNVEGYRRMQENKQKEFDKTTDAYKAKYGEMGKANGGPFYRPSTAEKAQSLDSGKSKNVEGYSKYNKAQYGEMGKANGGPSAAQKAQTTPYGHSKNTSTGSKTVQYKKQLTDTNYKYQKAVSSQGPSAAQKAQSYAKDGYSETSKNVGVGTKKVTYSESKYNKSVTNQGPSAAQKAQSYNKAGISTKSKNVNSGSKKVNYTHADYGPKKKKKKPFEKAIEWIKGAPGKVSVKSSYKTPKK